MKDIIDPLHINKENIPKDWHYEWKRQSLVGEDDGLYLNLLLQKGWRFIKQEDFPHGPVSRGGLVLMGISEKLYEAFNQRQWMDAKLIKANVDNKWTFKSKEEYRKDSVKPAVNLAEKMEEHGIDTAVQLSVGGMNFCIAIVSSPDDTDAMKAHKVLRDLAFELRLCGIDIGYMLTEGRPVGGDGRQL